MAAHKRIFRLALAFFLVLICLGTHASAAELRLPFGPSAQSHALAWAEPTGQGPVLALRITSVETYAIHYALQDAALRETATLRVVFDPSTARPTFHANLLVESARPALAILERRIRRATQSLHAPSVGDTDPPPESAKSTGWAPIEQALAPWLLALLLATLLAAAREMKRTFPSFSAPQSRALALILLVTAAALWALPDTVLYHAGHGWELVQLIHEGSLSDAHAGALAPLLSNALGAFASPGHEAFQAARLGALLAVFLMAMWLFLLTERPWLSVIAALLLALQPAFHYAGRSEYVATPGLALLLLALTLATWAGRERSLVLMAAATVALSMVASFRALGSVGWPVCALMFFVPRPVQPPRSARWFALPIAAVACVSWISLDRVLNVGVAYLPSEGLSLFPNLGQDQLLGDPIWSAPALAVAALCGCALWSVRRERTFSSKLTVMGLLALFLGVVFATQHVAGTYLNTPRYHLWLLVPGCAGAALSIDVLRRGRHWAHRGALFLLAGALVWGSLTPWALSLERHPESRQLDAWRATLRELPPGARLHVPVVRGEHRVALPWAELRASRPDVHLSPGPLPSQSGTFAFFPLDCMRASLDPDPLMRDDCPASPTKWQATPAATRSVSWSVPGPSGEGSIEGATDGDYWVYPPLRAGAGEVGLYRHR